MIKLDEDIFFQSIRKFVDRMNPLGAGDEGIEPLLIQRLCLDAYQEFLAANGFSVKINIEFSDLSGIRSRLHSQLCLVEFSNETCVLTFPRQNIEALTNNHGVTFIKKAIVIVPILETLLRSAPYFHAKFIFEIGDNGYLKAAAFCSKNHYGCLIPDFDFFETGGYRAFRRESTDAYVAWDNRNPTVFWRGSTTGMRQYSPPLEGAEDNFRWLPRLNLCVQGKTPGLNSYCDFGVTRLVNIPEPHLIARIQAAGIIRENVPISKFLEYKAIVDIDGNSNAWSGLFRGLLTGACIIKVASQNQFRQWYYNELRPFKHFVPVASDLNDLADAVAWVRSNDALAREVGQYGRNFSQSIGLANAIETAAASLARWIDVSADGHAR